VVLAATIAAALERLRNRDSCFTCIDRIIAWTTSRLIIRTFQNVARASASRRSARNLARGFNPASVSQKCSAGLQPRVGRRPLKDRPTAFLKFASRAGSEAWNAELEQRRARCPSRSVATDWTGVSAGARAERWGPPRLWRSGGTSCAAFRAGVDARRPARSGGCSRRCGRHPRQFRWRSASRLAHYSAPAMSSQSNTSVCSARDLRHTSSSVSDDRHIEGRTPPRTAGARPRPQNRDHRKRVRP
jgi:hypothetical protein